MEFIGEYSHDEVRLWTLTCSREQLTEAITYAQKQHLEMLDTLLLTRDVIHSVIEEKNMGVFKMGNSNIVSNYRPISLLSILGKCMEKCIFKYLYNFIHTHEILTPHQSGFRPNDSTVNQLLSITSDFYKAVDQGKEVRVIFFDISKAFDKVWHKGLLHKLKNIGICGELLAWFRSYLNDRRQCVVINGSKSEIGEIKAGVPQGSILGPLL